MAQQCTDESEAGRV